MKEKAQKKAIKIWAVAYTDNTDVEKLILYMEQKGKHNVSLNKETKSILIHKERGDIELFLNNWLIFEYNTDQEFWAIDKDIFFKTYDVVLGEDNIYIKKPLIKKFNYFGDLKKTTIINILENTNQEINEEKVNEIKENKYIKIVTLEGEEKLFLGEYLMYGVDNEPYPVKAENFEKVYSKL